MKESRLQDIFKTRLNAPPAEPLEATRQFLRTYCYDAISMDDIRESVAAMADVNPRTLLSGLTAINALLVEPPLSQGALLKIVSEDGNRRLKDATASGAKDWLHQVAGIVREELSKRDILE